MSESRVSLGEHFEVCCDAPLPHFNIHCLEAYTCELIKKKDKVSFLALVYTQEHPIRFDVLKTINLWDIPGMVRLEVYDFVIWPSLGRLIPVFIIHSPGEIQGTLAEVCPRWSEEKIVQSFINPMVQMLLSMHLEKIAYSALMPHNMWLTISDTVICGLPIALLSADEQKIYLPISVGMSHYLSAYRVPPSYDWYMLGACIMFMFNGALWPPLNESSEAVLLKKIQRGSFYLFLGRGHPSLKMLELLKKNLVR